MHSIDLRAQYRTLQKRIDRAITKTVHGGSFILGKNVSALESAIATMTGARTAIGVNSGTDALFLSLKAAGIGPGDEVITTPFTFIATAETIAACGAKPVFVDIDPKTYTINSERVARTITKHTKGIIPVHLYGQMAPMQKLLALAKKHHLVIIEDAAQALGATQMLYGKKRFAGSVGTFGCISFFPTKNLGAYGDAGMVLSNNAGFGKKVSLLRNHGSQKKYYHEFLGYSSRLDELQAAILLAKLPYLKQWNAARQKLAHLYTKALTPIPSLTLPSVAVGNTHVFHQYILRTSKRDALRTFLEKRGIPTAIHYPLPLHLQPAFTCLRYRKESFPEAEVAAREVLSLPLYPEMPLTHMEQTIRAIQLFFAKKT